ncbi:hypothetical protein SAMN05421874_12862 [Nonomuraea maritima]|uniref:Uncharacterized protein n=1 Tax=Nonomuraea maritima TaxID=683260 RepID=A0A1G9MJW4_9ACTN|nr:hypothetical protein [Nonomuraea maritima]SDL74291.1 hypothetical protein SAMN05421874_12862 [Nonomuraea maritima]
MPSYRRRSGDGDGCGLAVVTLTILASAVVALIATAPDDDPEVVADCVLATKQADGTYQIVDDRYCDGGSHAAYYHWLYGSSTTSRPGYVRGGTSLKPANAEITTRRGTVIQRGGFGRSGGGGGG